MLNRLLLVACIFILAASILFLFYWNRLLAFIFETFVRLALWNQGDSRVWFEIGSIHFSPIAGRILLRDLHYHSSNQTIKVVKLCITWRYWIRPHYLQEEPPRSSEARDNEAVEPHTRCKVHLSLQGYEWFLYNRTAAYESILSCLAPSINSAETQSSTGMEFVQPHSERQVHTGIVRITAIVTRVVAWVRQYIPALNFLDLLPLGIEGTKGAIVCGNSSTPELLVAEFRRAVGTYEIVQARSKNDSYERVLGLTFQQAIIRYVQNEDFKDTMNTTGKMVDEHIRRSQSPNSSQENSRLRFSTFSTLWKELRVYRLWRADRSRDIHPKTNSATSRSGRKTSADDEKPVDADPVTLEYAVERKLLEAPTLDLSYYDAIAGVVPVPTDAKDDTKDDDPEWGIDMVVHSGSFRYGPWADRRRVELQRTFFPPTFQNDEPMPPLKPGDTRVWTSFKVFVELRGDTILYVPFREASKNWLWDGQCTYPHPKKREPAFLRLNIGDASTISYVVPIVAALDGYNSRLVMDFDSVEVTSSLNDMKVHKAKSCQIIGDLPTPLKWNEERQWTFTLTFQQSTLSLLRDHINMFTDLAKDWTAGPPSDYFRFIPIVYAIQVELDQFELMEYANDHNIIDKPLVKEENALFTISGPRLLVDVRIPSNVFRPTSITVPFSVEGPQLSLSLSLPKWTTHTLLAHDLGTRFGTIGLFRLNGSYQYFTEVRPDYIEQLIMNFTLNNVAWKLLGWTIRHLIVLRENYLGSFTNFTTLYEYLEKGRKGYPIGDPITFKYRPEKSNVFQFELSVNVKHGVLALPAGLPGFVKRTFGQDFDAGTCVTLTVPAMQLQLRLHDFYMDMSLNADTVSGCIEQHCESDLFLDRPRGKQKESFTIDGYDVTANRLFGPQPRTSAYVCIWEIRVGDVKGSLSASEWQAVAAAATAFRLNFLDTPNAPALEYSPPVEPDVTIVKISIDLIDCVWLAGRSALVFYAPMGLKLSSNDRAGHSYSKLTSVQLPNASIKLLLANGARRSSWIEAGELRFDAYIDSYSSPPGWRETAEAQRDYVRTQDVLTGRAKVLFDNPNIRPEVCTHHSGLYLPLPRLPRSSTPPEATKLAREAKSTSVRPVMSQITRPLESDGEERVTEADRDARLARARAFALPGSFPIPDDSQELSSGDESDNEDLTDSISLDSDWSDIKSGHRRLALTSYLNLSKHYVAQFLAAPSTWGGPSLMLTLDPWTPADPGLAQKRLATSGAKMTPTPPRDSFMRTSDTVLRFESRSGIEVSMTPLVIPALTHMEADLEFKDRRPEFCIDSLISEHLARFPRSSGTKITALDVSVPSLRVSCSLRTDTAATDDSADLRDISTDHRAAVTVVNFAAYDCHLSGNIEQNDSVAPAYNLKTRISEARVNFNILMDRREGHIKISRSSITTVSELKIFSLRGTIVNKSSKLELEEVSVDIDQGGPQCLVASGVIGSRCIQDLMEIKKKWNSYDSAFKQKVIYGLLAFSQTKPIVDPLSTIQSTYLIRQGRPHDLRNDLTFRFLFHLRSCFWYLQDFDQQISTLPCDVSVEEAANLTKRRLIALSLHSETPDVTDLAFFSAIFPVAGSSEGFSTPSSSLTVQVRKIGLRVRHDPVMRPSETVIERLVISVNHRTQELLHTFPPYARPLPQTSMKQLGRETIWNLITSISAGDVTFIIYSHLMLFVQEVLRVRRKYSGGLWSSDKTSSRSAAIEVQTRLVHASVTILVDRLRAQAVAENLTFEIRARDVGLVSNSLSTPTDNRQSGAGSSTSHALMFNEITLRARTPADIANDTDLGVLASIVLKTGRANALTRQEPSSTPVVRVIWSMLELQINVPRSAIRLYRFVEEWRADFLPGLEATLQALITEVQKSPTIPSRRLSPVNSLAWSLQGSLVSFNVSLQVMHGTWLAWKYSHIIAHVRKSSTGPPKSLESFGMQVASQVFSISVSPTPQTTPDTRVRFKLPRLSVTGHRDQSQVHILACMDPLRVKLKPAHWDTLLSVQQKFGQDFNDFVLLLGETRRKQASSLAEKTPSEATTWQYTGFLKIKGFHIGLETKSSMAYLECDDIDGGIDNNAGRQSHLTLCDLALSLAPRHSNLSNESAADRGHRSAFVTTDFKINFGTRTSFEGIDHTMQLTVTKIHAVMRPSAIGEFGDFVDHIQAERLDRQEQRALELAAFKEKTRQILQTFDVKLPDERLSGKSLWLRKYRVTVAINSIGVAFPLSPYGLLELPHTGNRDAGAVRAFLFSIKSFAFGVNHGESGQATMLDLSFQFVPRFKQTSPSDFSGEAHNTRNRLIWPSMTASLRSTTSSAAQQFWIGAKISGFVLDIDSSIPDYIGSLINVYREGMGRVEELTANIPRQSDSSGPTSKPEPESMARSANTPPTSHVLASLTFLSGRIHVHSRLAAANLSRIKSLQPGLQEPTDEQLLDSGVVVLKLPVVSVWIEFRATPSLRKVDAGGEAEPSTLMLKSTVHSSENTVRPTLLPFLSELVNRVEARMAEQPKDFPKPQFAILAGTSSLNAPPDSVSSMRISFSLRIDQSKLEISCQPDANVIAGLHWDSGGFVVNVSPGARSVTFSGSVDGLTLGLKHGFLSEDCVRLDARNLGLSVTFTKLDSAIESGAPVSIISAVLDTEFSGVARLSRLQDVLCFKAVWLDRIPVFTGQAATATRPRVKDAVVFSTPPVAKTPFTTAVLVRVRAVELDVDFGQSISAVTLNLTNSILRTRFTGDQDEVSVFVEQAAVVAKGNVSGQLKVPDCLFETVRRKDSFCGTSLAQMLELRMTSGALTAVIESDREMLLQYCAQPMEIEIYDDWSMLSEELKAEEALLRLSFSVIGTEVAVVITAGTIPKLMAYVNKFSANLEAQREGAGRESQAFKVTRSPQPNALSTVANAMLHTARSRFSEVETLLSQAIQQTISLHLKLLRLVVFPRTMRDAELAHFVGSDVGARLDGIARPRGLRKRDLHLSFSSMTISKFSQLNHGLAKTDPPPDLTNWLALIMKDAQESIIVGLPSMKVRMLSEENNSELSISRTLLYDFKSKFVRGGGTQDSEDIYITLNMSLYSWLTVLRKSLSREIAQMRLVGERKTTVGGSFPNLTTSANIGKKKGVGAGENAQSQERLNRESQFDLHGRVARLERTLSGSDLASASSPASDLPKGALSMSPTDAIQSLVYKPRVRRIERLTIRQLGEATPNVMHPFFIKKAGFNLEESFPVYVHEYATVPLENILEVLLKIYSKQLKAKQEAELGDSPQ